jgi:cytochrome P450
MDMDEMVSTFGIIILAGSETTATLLSAVTFLLLKHPEVMDKLVNEIRTSFKSEEEITQVSVNKLTYQLAVLEEALRIHPPAPVGFPRVVPGEKGQVVAGHFVPAGVCSVPGNSTKQMLMRLHRQ